MNLFKKYKNKLRINYNLKQTTLIMIKKRYKKDIYTHNKRFQGQYEGKQMQYNKLKQKRPANDGQIKK